MSGGKQEATTPGGGSQSGYNIEADRQAGLKRVQEADIDEETRKELLDALKNAKNPMEIGATVPKLEAALEGIDPKYKERRMRSNAAKIQKDQPGLGAQTRLLGAPSNTSLLGGR